MNEALEHMFGSAGAVEAADRALRRMLETRNVYFGSGLLPSYAYAFVLAAEHTDRWAARAERFVEIAERVSRQLFADPNMIRELGFGDVELELIRIDPGYQRTCVLCRPDGIPVGHDVKFVELNSDSPAMMMFLDIVAQCVLELDAFAPLRGAVEAPRAADRLLDSLLDCYRERGIGPDAPAIAITDWEGQKTRYEHQRLAEHFTARGCPSVVCDPRAFRRVGRELHVEGRRIDLVYRRALGSELIEQRAEVEPLLGAYRDGAICMINPLRSYITGVKSVMSRPDLWGEDDVVPRTVLLDNEPARAMVGASPTKWALKRSLGHGGSGVVLPGPPNESAWADAMNASRSETWIAQEYLEVPRITIPAAPRFTEEEKYFNWNPFVFGGQYAGGLVRVSETPLINITTGGGLIATFTR